MQSTSCPESHLTSALTHLFLTPTQLTFALRPVPSQSPKLIKVGSPKLIKVRSPKLLKLKSPKLIKVGSPKLIKLKSPKLIKVRSTKLIKLIHNKLFQKCLIRNRVIGLVDFVYHFHLLFLLGIVLLSLMFPWRPISYSF